MLVTVDWTTYGDMVTIRRRRRKLTQAELAKLIGISRNMISMIERGATAPSYAIVMSLSAALDVDFPPDQPTEGGES